MTICLENETFWSGMHPFLYKDAQTRTPKELDSLLSLTKVPASSKVLDLACGYGRHALELAKRKYQVTACDKNGKLFESSKIKATEENWDVTWIEEDMRSFNRYNHFDLIVNLFFSFGFFEKQQEDQNVIRNIFRSLKPGGKFVMELLGAEVVRTAFQWRGWEVIDESIVLLIERQLVQNCSWLNEFYTVINNGKKESYSCGLRLYDANDIKQLLLDQGFEKIKISGDFDGAAYDEKAQRLVVVAEKPSQDAHLLRC